MPQLNNGGGDDLGANDEMIAFKDEGEQDEKIQENAFTERDLADLKSSLVNESEISQNSHPPVVLAMLSRACLTSCFNFLLLVLTSHVVEKCFLLLL